MPLGVTRAMLSVLAVALQLLGPCSAPAADRSAQFDLVVRGGRVIDPESGLDGVRDIGVGDGRIALIAERRLAGRKMLDASGLIVVTTALLAAQLGRSAAGRDVGWPITDRFS